MWIAANYHVANGHIYARRKLAVGTGPIMIGFLNDEPRIVQLDSVDVSLAPKAKCVYPGGLFVRRKERADLRAEPSLWPTPMIEPALHASMIRNRPADVSHDDPPHGLAAAVSTVH